MFSVEYCVVMLLYYMLLKSNRFSFILIFISDDVFFYFVFDNFSAEVQEENRFIEWKLVYSYDTDEESYDVLKPQIKEDD